MPAKKKTIKSKLSLLKVFGSKVNLVLFSLIFGIIGVYFLWHGSAESTLLTSVQAEKMSLPKGVTIVTDSNASGSKVIKFPKTPTTVSGSFSLNSTADNLRVMAKTTYCPKEWPKLTVSIDGNEVSTTEVKDTNWHEYSFSKNISAGSHKLSLAYIGNYGSSRCTPFLSIDVTNFYGPVTTSPTPAPIPSGTSGSSTRSKIYGANNFVGWGSDAYANAKNLLGINGERVCHDETNLSSTLPKLAAIKVYLSVCVNSEEAMKSLDSHKQDYANETASLAKTYGPGGTFWGGRSDGEYAIQTFELMNEPYGWWYRGGDNDPAAYAHIALAAIKAGKAANPNAKFYLSLAPSDVKLKNGTWVNWNQALLDAEPTLFQWADGFSLHLYGTPSYFTTTLDKWQSWAWTKNGGNNKPFIITESNLTDQYASTEQDYINAIPLFVQAAKNRAWVKELFIFCYHGFSGRDYLGFLDSNGNVRQTRANAYKNAIIQAQQ